MLAEEREAAGKSAEERERGQDWEGRKERQREKLEIFRRVMYAVIVFSLSLSCSLALNGQDVACICQQDGTQFGTIYSAVSALMYLRDRE